MWDRSKAVRNLCIAHARILERNINLNVLIFYFQQEKNRENVKQMSRDVVSADSAGLESYIS